jgi:hypothetical protein
MPYRKMELVEYNNESQSSDCHFSDFTVSPTCDSTNTKIIFSFQTTDNVCMLNDPQASQMKILMLMQAMKSI